MNVQRNDRPTVIRGGEGKSPFSFLKNLKNLQKQERSNTSKNPDLPASEQTFEMPDMYKVGKRASEATKVIFILGSIPITAICLFMAFNEHGNGAVLLALIPMLLGWSMFCLFPFLGLFMIFFFLEFKKIPSINSTQGLVLAIAALLNRGNGRFSPENIKNALNTLQDTNDKKDYK
jgi:hypothetical protein